MQVVTLTSDMGTGDFYPGLLRGSVLTHIPGAQVVDISHHIPLGNISAGALALKTSYPHFPKGTIHIVAVDTNLYGNIRHVVFEADHHFFVGTDNGIFSMALHQPPAAVFEITSFDQPGNYTFPAAFLFTRVAGMLAEGMKPSEIGKPTFGILEKTQFNAVVDASTIKGSVVYVDAHGNLITNIDRELFERVGRGRKYAILIRRSDYAVRKISRFYSDVPDGEMVALFNHAGLLEMALNMGNISKMLGMDTGDVVRIEFQDIG